MEDLSLSNDVFLMKILSKNQQKHKLNDFFKQFHVCYLGEDLQKIKKILNKLLENIWVGKMSIEFLQL